MGPFSSRDALICYSRSLKSFTKRLEEEKQTLKLVQFAILLTFSVTLMLCTFYLTKHVSIALLFTDNTTSDEIEIWHQNEQCLTSNLTSDSSVYSHNSFPYAVLRDIALDKRPSISKFYNDTYDVNNLNIVRIVLFITVHNSARLSYDQSKASILHDNELQVKIDHVLHSTAFLLRRSHKFYTPGQRTVHGRQVTEWQVGISINYKNHVHLLNAIENNLRLVTSINLLRFNNVVPVPFHPALTMSCIYGLKQLIIHKHGKQQQQQKEQDNSNCWHSLNNRHVGNSILISSNPLYGKKRKEAGYYKEVAHFALRALNGHIQFDRVIMTVVQFYSQSDINVICNTYDNYNVKYVQQCKVKMIRRNHKFLQTISIEIKKEILYLTNDDNKNNKNNLDAEEILKKIVLLPICQLGSDSKHSEVWDACAQSKHYGQYWTSSLAYSMISSDYKWAVSYDMDEFFSFEPSIKSSSLLSHNNSTFHASHVFDHSNHSNFVIQWLNFKLNSLTDSRSLTSILVNGQLPFLRDKYNISRSSRCFYKLADDTGKAAVRCDVGLGFTIHHPVTIAKNGKTNQLHFKQGKQMFRDLRTYHARFSRSKGPCEHNHEDGALNYFQLHQQHPYHTNHTTI